MLSTKKLTHSAVTSPASQGGVREHHSGSTHNGAEEVVTQMKDELDAYAAR
jgi:hypothetical protein